MVGSWLGGQSGLPEVCKNTGAILYAPEAEIMPLNEAHCV